MRRRTVPAALLLALSACASGHIGSAADPIPLNHLPALAGDYFRMPFAAAGRDFHIYVRLPEGYGTEPERHYPVVYLLDGDSLFPILATHHLFLTLDERLPEAIIVGIAYGSFDPAVNRRGVDFTGPAPGVPPAEAGAPAFHLFLKRHCCRKSSAAIAPIPPAGSWLANRAAAASSSIPPSPNPTCSGAGSPAIPPSGGTASAISARRPRDHAATCVSSSPAARATVRRSGPMPCAGRARGRSGGTCPGRSSSLRSRTGRTRPTSPTPTHWLGLAVRR